MWKPNIKAASGPRYLAMADAIEGDVKQGRLTPGTKLPTHRDLAEMLGVTVGTVTRGYAEAARRGVVRGETGRGTFVGGDVHSAVTLVSHREDAIPGVVDMSMTLPFEGLNPDLSGVLAHVAADPLSNRLLEYYPSCGRTVDREAGVEWIRRHNLNVLPEVVVVTVGGQNSLAVVLSAMFRPGDAIAVEALTYPLIKTLARRFHLKLIPIPMDEGGMIPDALAEACRTQSVQGVYLMPSCQNPTTVRMPEYRRQEVAALAQRNDLFIIEDDAYGLAAGVDAVPLASLAPERTFFIASMSKSVAGGLRVAYLASPSYHIKAVERAISDMVWMTPPLMAEIARRWIDDGTADRTVAARREEAKIRTDMAKNILSKLDISLQKTGYHAWLKLPEPWTSADFVRVAEESDVLVTTDDIFVVGRSPLPHAVRIALSGPRDCEELHRGLRVIRNILGTN